MLDAERRAEEERRKDYEADMAQKLRAMQNMGASSVAGSSRDATPTVKVDPGAKIKRERIENEMAEMAEMAKKRQCTTRAGDKGKGAFIDLTEDDD